MNEYLLHNGCISSLSQLQERNTGVFWESNQPDVPTGHCSGPDTRALSVISLLINFPLITEAISDTGKKKPFFLLAWSRDLSPSHPKAVPKGEFTWDPSPGPFPMFSCRDRGNNEGFSPEKPAQSSISLEQQNPADKQEESTPWSVG